MLQRAISHLYRFVERTVCLSVVNRLACLLDQTGPCHNMKLLNFFCNLFERNYDHWDLIKSLTSVWGSEVEIRDKYCLTVPVLNTVRTADCAWNCLYSHMFSFFCWLFRNKKPIRTFCSCAFIIISTTSCNLSKLLEFKWYCVWLFESVVNFSHRYKDKHSYRQGAGDDHR